MSTVFRSLAVAIAALLMGAAVAPQAQAQMACWYDAQGTLRGCDSCRPGEALDPPCDASLGGLCEVGLTGECRSGDAGDYSQYLVIDAGGQPPQTLASPDDDVAVGGGDCSDSIAHCYNACYQEVRRAGGTEHTGSYETSPCTAGCAIQFDPDNDVPGYHAMCTALSPEIHTQGDCSDNIRRCYNACYQEVRNAGGTEYTGSPETSPCWQGCTIQFSGAGACDQPG